MKVYYEEQFLKGTDIANLFKNYYDFSSLESCDYVVITSIDNSIIKEKNNLKELIIKSKKNNKKILFFGQGDGEEGYINESIGYNFKNNLYKSKKYKNEFALTSLSLDRIPNRSFIPFDRVDISIGFCGASNRYFNRDRYLYEASQTKYKTNFIIRNGYHWGTTGNEELTEQNLLKIQRDATEDFYNNINDNLFTLCMRGYGNYSYRFCQTICMGRIPIHIDTDCSLPFEEIFDYNKYIVNVKIGMSIEEAVDKFLSKNINNLLDIQNTLYAFGNEYLIPSGYFKNLYKLIHYYERSN